MKRETIAIHTGYDGDPTTKAVAVPIYQTVAFEFDSAEHGAALFNLEVEGNIYTRIGNPTNAVLEKRVAALEGGVDGLSVSSGMAAIEYALINIAETGNNIVSLPQLYGATYTLLAHIFPKRGITLNLTPKGQGENLVVVDARMSVRLHVCPPWSLSVEDLISWRRLYSATSAVPIPACSLRCAVSSSAFATWKPSLCGFRTRMTRSRRR